MKKVAIKLFTCVSFILLMTATLIVSASTSEASITINRAAYSNVSLAGRSFFAYKIFDANGGITDEFLAFNNYPGYGAVGLRSYIENLNDNSHEMNELARNLWGFISSNSISASGSQTAAANDSVTIENLPYGYYLVYGSAESGGAVVVAAATLTTVNSHTTITLKASAPTAINRRVWDRHRNDWAATTSASIGDKIDYWIFTSAPSMTGYTSYAFTIHEKLDLGLTFDPNSIVVARGSVNLNEGVHYTLNINSDGDNTFSIEFDPSVFVNFPPGAGITVNYSGTLTRDALIDTPNVGETVLEFSNNPFDITSTATTAKATTAVFTFALDIEKYTGTLGNGHTMLANAEFELRTSASNSSTAISFVQSEAGSSTAKRVYTHATLADAERAVTMITPGSGMLYLRGLDVGTYYLVETKAPAGYNRLENPITVVIAHANVNNDSTLTVNGTLANPRIIYVQNNAGALLPSTGGVGNTAFIITGLSIMAGAVILFLFYRRRRLCGNIKSQ